MRWLLIVLLVCVVGLLVASGGVAMHVWRAHRKKHPRRPAAGEVEEHEVETEEAHEQ